MTRCLTLPNRESRTELGEGLRPSPFRRRWRSLRPAIPSETLPNRGDL